MDCRSFGRFTLVGTHVIGSLSKYVWKEVSLLSEVQQTATKFMEVFIDPRTVLPAKLFNQPSRSKVKARKGSIRSKRVMVTEESAEFVPTGEEEVCMIRLLLFGA